MEWRYLPVRMADVIGYGEQILNNRLGTSDAHLGENWGQRFLHRHSSEPQLTTSKRIDEQRVMAKNPTYVMEFYVMVSGACSTSSNSLLKYLTLAI
jgi:hypothetical protein